MMKDTAVETGQDLLMDRWRPGRDTTIFSIEIQGEPWTVTTNNAALLAVPGKHADPDENRSERTAELLTEPMSEQKEWRLDDLRAACDECLVECPEEHDAAGKITCPECFGTAGYLHECYCGHKHDRECSWCDGSGRAECFCGGRLVGKTEFPRFSLGVAEVNAEILHDLLLGLPGESVMIEYGDDLLGFIQLQGDGWLGGIMPMRV